MDHVENIKEGTKLLFTYLIVTIATSASLQFFINFAKGFIVN